MTDGWMHSRITDYWDEQVHAIDVGARRLERLPGAARAEALGAIQSAVIEHVRVMPDELLAQAAIPFADDLYKAACAIDRWDETLEGYIKASAGTMSSLLAERGMQVQYLVDNAWHDLTKPLHLLTHWYQAAGFVYACPDVIAVQLASHDGVDAGSDINAVLGRYGAEARHVVGELVARCQRERRSVMQLDTDSAEDSFSAAFAARGAPGVITVFRDAAPEPGTQVTAWLPAS